MYKEASKLMLRFTTSKGVLTVEQLWTLSLTELDKLAVQLEEQYKASGKKSFLVKKSRKDKELKLAFDIVIDILSTKVEEKEVMDAASDVKAHNQKILGIIQEKKDEQLKGMSLKELEEQLK